MSGRVTSSSRERPEVEKDDAVWAKLRVIVWPNTTLDRPEEGRIIQHYVQDMKLSLQLTRPWETLILQVCVPTGRNIASDIAPVVGDWITVDCPRAKTGSNEDPSTIFFGYVDSVVGQATAMPDGRKDYLSLSITAVSWLEVMGRNQVFVSPLLDKTVGTLIAARPTKSALLFADKDTGLPRDDLRETTRSWKELIDALLTALPLGGSVGRGMTNMGRALSKAWVTLGTVVLPVSLGSEPRYDPSGGSPKIVSLGFALGDVVPVVFDEDTRNKYAPRVTVDPIPGWSIETLGSITPSGQSTLDILMGAFMGDQNMMEFFPSLEPFDRSSLLISSEQRESDALERDPRTEAADDAFDARQKQLSKVRETNILIKDKAFGGNFGRFVAEVNEDYEGRPASILGQSLGVNPVIIYRMKPWRAQSLKNYVYNPFGPAHPDNTGQKARNVDQRIFNKTTWNLKDDNGNISHGFKYSEDDITTFSFQRQDTDVVNCTTVGLPNQPGSAIRFLSQAGLPIRAKRSIEQQGLRLFSPRWPFFPPLDRDPTFGSSPDFFTSLYTIALQAMQFLGGADRFYKGSFTFATFRPELRPGMTVELDIPDLLPKSRLGQSGERTSDQIFTAYVASVQHAISVNAESGTITASTTVQYERGYYEASLLTRQFSNPKNMDKLYDAEKMDDVAPEADQGLVEIGVKTVPFVTDFER